MGIDHRDSRKLLSSPYRSLHLLLKAKSIGKRIQDTNSLDVDSAQEGSNVTQKPFVGDPFSLLASLNVLEHHQPKSGKLLRDDISVRIADIRVDEGYEDRIRTLEKELASTKSLLELSRSQLDKFSSYKRSVNYYINLLAKSISSIPRESSAVMSPCERLLQTFKKYVASSDHDAIEVENTSAQKWIEGVARATRSTKLDSTCEDCMVRQSMDAHSGHSIFRGDYDSVLDVSTSREFMTLSTPVERQIFRCFQFFAFADSSLTSTIGSSRQDVISKRSFLAMFLALDLIDDRYVLCFIDNSLQNCWYNIHRIDRGTDIIVLHISVNIMCII